jgi:serine/threonine-protein kinase
MPPPSSTLDPRAQRRVGQVLAGKYTLERVLGVGGMATVYLGVHRNGNRVAVKVLHSVLSIDDDVRARFLREGYVANSLGHPGAVRVLDDDVAEDGSAFLVMELLDGETLEQRRKRRGGQLPHGEVLALAHQLLGVLAAAHEKGVVHRDIKPENLFLTRGGELKVLDFGIARVLDPTGMNGTGTGSRLGTPAFMPPEQALGRAAEIDARSDLWAVGATMFTLLTGAFAHDAETAAELVVRTATRPARALGSVWPEAPAQVAAIVDRAVAFAPGDRWQSARAMSDAVEEAYLALHGEALAPFAPAVRPGGLSAPPSAPDAALNVTLPSEEALAELAARATLAVATDLVSSASPTLPAATDPPPPPAATSLPPPPPAPAAPTSVARPLRRAWPRPRALALATLVLLGAGLGAAGGFRAARPPAPTPSAASAAPAGCTDNRACTAARGAPAICHKDSGACVTLASEDCQVLAEPGDLASDATIWVGAMFPTAGADAPDFGRASQNAVELGRRDFAEISGGLPPARPGGPRRPLAVVACDDRADPERAARHLVDEVRVPAVIGFARSKEVAELASSIFIPRGVLALASNTASMLRTIPHAPGEPRLVWRTTTSSDMMASSCAALASEIIEPSLRSTPGLLRAGEPMRVAVVRVGNPSGQGFADVVVSRLRFNGRGVLENGDAFRQIVVPDTLTDASDEASQARVRDDLLAFAPHLVIGAGGLDSRVVLAVERAWPASRAARPRYVLDTLTEAAFFTLVKERPEARGRLFSTDTVSTTPAVGKFALRYNEVFSPKITPRNAQGAPYDAFYLLAYAVAALGDQPVTGAALARALPRLLPPGEPVDVGPGGIHAALAALGSGRGIDLGGTVTSLDFDLETGDATADFSVYCLGPGAHGDARDVVETGLVLDARATKLRGALRCQ